ncbi:MAG: hypothetical protein WB987_09785 [Candidatus Acidiferrales bacterium]
MRSRQAAILFLVPLMAALAGWSSRPTGFEWPDSSHYWRVMVNVNQYIGNRPKEWFAQDKIITDLAIEKVDPANEDAAAKQYKKLRHDLEARGIYVGTYTSGRTVGPAAEQTSYPPGSVAIEQMPASARYTSSWPGQPDRKIIDVTDPATRHAFQKGLRQLWESVPAPIRFVDNAAVHPALGRGEPWKAYCENMGEIRRIAESQGSRVIFNIAMHVALLSDEDTRELIEAVGRDNGIALEMPWHPNIQKSPEATAKAQARYRQLLDSGLVVIMIPVDTPASKLSGWIQTWRKPSDHLYISGVFWKAPDLTAYSDR